MPIQIGMTRTMKIIIAAAIASMGRRRITIQRACVAWKIISKSRDANPIPAQYANATRYE